MTILISLILALLLSWYGAKAIKQHAKWFYIGSAVLGVLVIVCTWSGVVFPAWVQTWVWPILSRGAFATALFMIVMFMATLPNGSASIKRLMPIRAELSIMASILTLGHNIAFGKTYFVRLFTQPSALPTAQLLAAICSVIMLCIMLPLFITSFKTVRRKMNAKKWKKLQRLAYGFYGLTYVHVMLLNVSAYQAGNQACLLNILAYSVIYFTYAALRVRKALLRKNPAAARFVPLICAAAGVLTCVLCLYPWQTAEAADENADAPGEVVTYADGSYVGTAKGFNGDITVMVRVQDGAISSVTVVQTSDDNPYWTNATALIDSVIAQQTADVDGISGATYSSNGLKAAIAQALEGAAAK